ncbi:hypothetical protein C1H46_005219 [Malus baccata]|uniref:AMP-dependent synthetase/ligase domain-containing protein n=1 Tax=Malus baccata TaxID=106549 RepID=A0A540NE11_MALBA|nr:hypothetical protein C1H46_005219 [Malus baccata]
MATEQKSSCGDGGGSIDPKSGFCSKTKTFHSLRPKSQLPVQTTPLSLTHYILSRLHQSSPPPSTPALVHATTGHQILYPEFILRVQNLAASLQSQLGLSHGQCAFVLSPNSLHLPILHLSLLYLGVIVSPSNPANSNPEISRQISLCNPAVAFATSDTAHKIPNSLRLGTVLLDSSEFESMMLTCPSSTEWSQISVSQSDTATILYSSGTTGRVKGVELTHRNWISNLASSAARNASAPHAVCLCTAPFFHVYGMAYCLRVLSTGDTLVWMARFDMKTMLRSIERFGITHVAWAPPVAVALTKYGDGNEMGGYDLSSLQVIACGGAPLAKSVIEKLRERLPNVQVSQAYGMTETTARVFAAVGPEETGVEGANGKLMSDLEAKIVDPESGTALPPLMHGELWVRGPNIMKGYVGDEAATAAILDSEGWLKTGDICYIDNQGFLFFVDRLKELIKYNGYQVAPAELEDLLHSHPDIVDATVIPYADEEAGQVPMAFVVRCLGSAIDESRIKDFIAKQVAPYKKIRRVTFTMAIPKNAQGKVLRKELIKLALSKL